ncbi:MAG: sigma-54 dependent transcriptional regulator [Thermodesulfobacteriota bacterium]|nr:sigma-54 dependent transcriptional regulator [Thermodesulfobacteriota bacterium]
MEDRKKILIVDDELAVRESLRMILEREYKLLMASNGEKALKILEKEHPHLVLLDIIMPDLNGIEILRRIKEKDGAITVIMITAIKTVKTAVESMKLGAYDYLNKPFDLNEVRLLIKKAFPAPNKNQGMGNIEKVEGKKISGFDNIVSRTKVMEKIFAAIKQVASSKATILITGESGTGKELVAKAIHFNGPRKNRPFIAINCSAVPETLIESELFGYEKGAFTNAFKECPGKFEIADSGTLFLDEIGDLSLTTQAKILRFLQEKELTRLGGTKTQKVDVRMIAATNKDLEKSMREGSFREDLFYRINVVPIFIPQLRKRKDDIPLLVDHFLNVMVKEEGKKMDISPKAMEILMDYDWPGNVRELENIIERMAILIKKEVVLPEDLPSYIKDKVKIKFLKKSVLENRASFSEVKEDFEKKLIFEALKKTDYVQTRAARLLGTTRRVLKYKMDKLGIKKASE